MTSRVAGVSCGLYYKLPSGGSAMMSLHHPTCAKLWTFCDLRGLTQMAQCCLCMALAALSSDAYSVL